MAASTFRAGVAAGATYLAPATKVTPSGPTDVQLSIVSATSLGVSWRAPVESGGDTVTKYLSDWIFLDSIEQG